MLDTSVGYFLGGNEQANLFKDPAMLKRFQEISGTAQKGEECFLTAVENLLRALKIV